MAGTPNFSGQTSQITFTNPTATQRSRVGGSGFTAFAWEAQIVTFARQISHQSPAPVASVVPIHPLDSTYPIELVTPQAISMGTLVLELYERYNSRVWDNLLRAAGMDATGVVDLAGVFMTLAASKPLHLYRIIKPPKLVNGKTQPWATREYHGCVISSIDDGETIEVGTMEVLKRLVVNYTYVTEGSDGNVMLKGNTAALNA